MKIYIKDNNGQFQPFYSINQGQTIDDSYLANLIKTNLDFQVEGTSLKVYYDNTLFKTVTLPSSGTSSDRISCTSLECSNSSNNIIYIYKDEPLQLQIVAKPLTTTDTIHYYIANTLKATISNTGLLNWVAEGNVSAEIYCGEQQLDLTIICAPESYLTKTKLTNMGCSISDTLLQTYPNLILTANNGYGMLLLGQDMVNNKFTKSTVFNTTIVPDYNDTIICTFKIKDDSLSGAHTIFCSRGSDATAAFVWYTRSGDLTTLNCKYCGITKTFAVNNETIYTVRLSKTSISIDNLSSQSISTSEVTITEPIVIGASFNGTYKGSSGLDNRTHMTIIYSLIVKSGDTIKNYLIPVEDNKILDLITSNYINELETAPPDAKFLSNDALDEYV